MGHPLRLDWFQEEWDFQDGERRVGNDGSGVVRRRAGINAFVDSLHIGDEEDVFVGALHVHASIPRRREVVSTVLLPRDFRRRTPVGRALETRHASGFNGDVDRDFLEDGERVDVDVGAFGVRSAELIADDALVETRVFVANVEEMKNGGEARDGIVFVVRRGVVVDGTLGYENVVFLPLKCHRS